MSPFKIESFTWLGFDKRLIINRHCNTIHRCGLEFPFLIGCRLSNGLSRGLGATGDRLLEAEKHSWMPTDGKCTILGSTTSI